MAENNTTKVKVCLMKHGETTCVAEQKMKEINDMMAGNNIADLTELERS